MSHLSSKKTDARPLTILHVASHEGVYRGGAVQLSRMARAQARRGHRVAVAINLPRGLKQSERDMHLATWTPLREAGIPIHALALESLGGVWKLRRLMRAGGFDIVHAHRDQALLAAWWAVWGLARPALVAQRGTVTPPPDRPRQAFASPRTRAVTAVARAVREALIEEAGPAMAPKTHVVYGSVDLEQFAPRPPDAGLLRELELPAGARVVGSLSAWRRDKGFELILDALAAAMRAEAGESGERKLFAVFLGRGVREHVEALAVERGIADRCRFVGHQPDVARWLSIMELTMVAAHKREGLSGVLRESLAMEVPAITTDCAGNGEMVRDGETGLLVPVGDAAALERALRRALAAPESMKAMARAGRRWVVENCSMEIQAERCEAVYRRVL